MIVVVPVVKSVYLMLQVLIFAEENSFLLISSMQTFFFFFFNSFDWIANIQGFSITLISGEKCVCFR